MPTPGSPEWLRDLARTEASFFRAYSDLEAGRPNQDIAQHAWLDVRVARRYVAEVRWRIPMPAITSLLDVGCGPGTILQAWHEVVPHARLVGIDASAAAVRYAQHRLAAATFQCRVLEPATELDDRFQVIHVREFYPFTRSPDPALPAAYLAMLARHLRLGGVVIISHRSQPHTLDTLLRTGRLDADASGLRLEHRYELSRVALRRCLPVPVAARLSPALRRLLGREREVLLALHAA